MLARAAVEPLTLRSVGNPQIIDGQWPIWGGDSLGHEQSQQGFTPSDMTEVFKVLSFGLPTMVRLDEGTVLLAFWCEEEGITHIKTYRLHLL